MQLQLFLYSMLQGQVNWVNLPLLFGAQACNPDKVQLGYIWGMGFNVKEHVKIGDRDKWIFERPVTPDNQTQFDIAEYCLKNETFDKSDFSLATRQTFLMLMRLGIIQPSELIGDDAISWQRTHGFKFYADRIHLFNKE